LGSNFDCCKDDERHFYLIDLIKEASALNSINNLIDSSFTFYLSKLDVMDMFHQSDLLGSFFPKG
jgi:hypothetical protein